MIKDLLNGCLFFTANQLAREVGKMADEQFATIGLSSSYAFLVLAVDENPGITLTDLCDIVQIAPSTGSRFVDKLILKGWMERKTEGKLAKMHLTDKGRGACGDIRACWDQVYERYSAILGKEQGDRLTKLTLEASGKLKTR